MGIQLLSRFRKFEGYVINRLLPEAESIESERKNYTKLRINLWLIAVFFATPFFLDLTGNRHVYPFFWSICALQILYIFIEKRFPRQAYSVDVVLGGIPLLVFLFTNEETFSMGGLLWFAICPIVCAYTLSTTRTLIWTTVAIAMPYYFVAKFAPEQLFGELTTHITLVTLVMTVIALLFCRSTVKMTKSLETSSRIRQNLLRVLCHDVTNPMCVIKGNLRLMQKSKETLPVAFQKHMKKAEVSCQILEQIVNQARDNEIVQGSGQVVELRTVKLDLVWDNLKHVFEDAISQKDLKIVWPQESGMEIAGNEAGLQNQVLANLLTNAIKFSNPGQNIEIVCDRRGGDIVIKVKDNGVGMPQSILSNIFEEGLPASRLGTAGEKGTGFGMPIVKFWVESMNGKIEVTSIEGQGTEFCLRFKKA